jgi:thioredoxin-like negative regulator of GroEL
LVSKLSNEYVGRLAVARIDVRHNKEKVREYQVRVTPTSFYMRNAAQVKRMEGYVKYDELKKDTDEVLEQEG